MLILMRKPGESVMIGDDVIVTVKKIEGNRVCFGIEAPESIPVDREEIYNKRRAEQGLPPVRRERSKK